MPVLPLLLVAAACSDEDPGAGSNATSLLLPKQRLASSTLESSGFSTILYAEPATLDEPLPVKPPAVGANEAKDGEAIRSAKDARAYLRILPQTEENAGPVPLSPSYGTLQLHDGCLRVKRTPVPGTPTKSTEQLALAVFSPGMRVFVDKEGYLSLHYTDDGFTGAPVRVGEELIFSAAPEVKDEELVAEIREACGDGPLVWVNKPGSFYRRAMAEAAGNAGKLATLRGVSVEAARQKMLEQLRGSEAARKDCALSGTACKPRSANIGDGWPLMWPTPPQPVR